jgi:hypothetical protein
MAIRFRLVPGGVEEAQFKRVAQGWLFTTANPWVFGPRRTFLVSDSQKALLAESVRRSRYIRLILIVPISLLLALAFVMIPSALNVRSLEAWLVFGALVVLVTGAISLSDYLTVRPLLRDTPRSSQKIGVMDMLARQSEAMSVTALATSTVIFVIATAGQTYQGLTSMRVGALALIGAVAFAFLAFLFGTMLIAKLRATHDSSSETSSAIVEPEVTIGGLAARLNGVERASKFVALGFLGLIVFAAVAAGMFVHLFERVGDASAAAQSFVLRDAKGDMVANLIVGSDGLPALTLFDGAKNLRALLGLRNKGTPFLSLIDANRKSRWLATVGEGNQGPRLQLLDINGTARWSANVNDVSDVARGADLRLTNADGGGGWFARVSDRGSELRLSDAKGNVRWSVSVDDDGAHVKTFDAAGKEVPIQR